MAQVRHEVGDLLTARLRASPVADKGARRELARSLLTNVLVARSRDRVLAGREPWSIEEEFALAEAVMNELFGLGALQPLIDDPLVENIEVNGYDNVWVVYADGRHVQHPPIAGSDEELVQMIQALAARTGGSERSFSTSSARLHLRLDDGSRLAAIGWVSPRPLLVIRRHRVPDIDLEQMVAQGNMSVAVAEFLAAALRAGKNIIVTGAQNSGKTTLLRALAAEFDPMERFATIEREHELHLFELADRHPRVIALEARIGSSEWDPSGRAAGEITVADLVTEALRMNLRRIIVGEVRGPEVLPMLEAMSVGDGSMCTLHVRAAGKAMDRIVSLVVKHSPNTSDGFAYRAAADGIDFIVHLSLVERPGTPAQRFVSEIIEIDGIGESGRPVSTTVFTPGPDRHAVPAHHPHCLPELVDVGFDPSLLDTPHLDPIRELARRGDR